MSFSKVYAPYNFVPLSGFIYEPSWSDEVSHDIPFPDGLSGSIEVELQNHTPLLVGQHHEKADKDKNKPGKVNFCEASDHYVIPGSSIKGMLRNVLEIASFSKMRFVDNGKLGIRDISGGDYLREVYPAKMKNQKAGFLQLSKNPGKNGVMAEITPCEFVHVEHNELKQHPDIKNKNSLPKCLFMAKNHKKISEKYKQWGNFTGGSFKALDALPQVSFSVVRKDGKLESLKVAKLSEEGKHTGELVFTGQISDKCTGKRSKFGKSRDFIFYESEQNSQDTIKVSSESLADFRQIHGESDEKQKDGAWQNYWQARFRQGIKVPVFYHASGSEVRSMGLAFMYKLAYANSIGDAIAHTNPQHHYSSVSKYDLISEEQYDLTELLMGSVDPEGEGLTNNNSRSLKSRVSISLFQGPSVGAITPEKHHDATILSTPNPSYFPNYIQQDVSANNQLQKGRQTYKTFMDDNVEIRGWKRYPVKSNNLAKVEVPEGKAKENVKVQVQLHPLPVDTSFHGKIRFHNLKAEELGALLWCLQWGGVSSLRHSLGMGKPFGFGQVSFKPVKAEIFSNTDLREETLQEGDLDQWISDLSESFEALMQSVFEVESDQKTVSWKDSSQIQNLLAMANPDTANDKSLKYMKMGMNIPANDFVQAKKQGLFLGDYAKQDAGQDQQFFARKSPHELQRQREERLQQQREQKVLKAREEELAKLTPLERSIEEVKLGEPQLPAYLALLKALDEGYWDSVEDQQEIAKKVRELMKAEGRWKEESAKKNKLKDKPYQFTLKVMAFLS